MEGASWLPLILLVVLLVVFLVVLPRAGIG